MQTSMKDLPKLLLFMFFLSIHYTKRFYPHRIIGPAVVLAHLKHGWVSEWCGSAKYTLYNRTSFCPSGKFVLYGRSQ